MSGEEKKEIDFFSEEIESSIDSLFKPKRLIEIDPLTNQIREIDASPTLTTATQPEITPAPPPPKPDLKPDTSAYIDELKQALLAFEWEISDKNLDTLKNLLLNLEKHISLDHPVTKNIHSMILDNINLMSKNPLKIPAKGPTALQKGIDVLILYHQKGDDAILQLGDNITQTLTLLEDVRATLQEHVITEPRPEIDLEPIAQQRPEPKIEMPIPETKPADTPLELELELEPATEPGTKKTDAPQLSPQLELEIDDLIDKKIVANQPPPSHTQPKPPESHLELSLELETPEKTPTPQVGLAKPAPAAETKPSEIESRKIQLTDTPSTRVISKEQAPTATVTTLSSKVTETLNEQIQRFNDYIEKLTNLESVCCNVQSLAKICQFARKMRNDIERDRKQLIDLLGKDYRPTHTATPSKENLFQTDITTPITQEISEIFQITWGNETIGILPEEIAFEGTLSFWYNLFYGNKISRLNEIPLSILRPFPWSSIKSSLKGQILNLDDNTLKSLKVPVKKSPSHPLGIPKNPIIIVLYRDGKCISLFTPTKPQPKLVGDFTFVPQEDEYFIGYLQKNNEKIKLLSLKKLS